MRTIRVSTRFERSPCLARHASVLAPALTLLALGLLGCAEEEVRVGPCDPRLVACQERLARAVSEARGGPEVDLPPVDVITEDELRAFLEGEVEEPTPAEMRQYEVWGHALMLLRLVQSPAALTTGSIDDFVANVAAFYDPDTGGITVIDRGMPTNFAEASYVFAHELTHRAQDIDHEAGFAAHEGLSDSLDGDDALGHHVEGEATVVGNLVLVGLRDQYVSAQGWRDYFAEWLAATRVAVVTDTDPYLVVRSQLKYVVGGAFLMDAWFDGGADNLRQQWDPAILETANWMRGYDSRIAAARFVECEFPSVPAGYSVWADDRLGGEMLFAMLVPDGEAGEAYLSSSWASAANWQGDHLRVLVGNTGGDPVAVAYRVRAATVDQARDIAERLRTAQLEDAVVSQEGSDVLLLLSEQPGLWDTWAYPLTCPVTAMRISPTRVRSMADRLPIRGVFRQR